MPRGSKFRSKAEFTEGDVSVHIGRRSNEAVVKVVLNPDCAVIVDLDDAMDLADALDAMITAYESDPLLWQ